MMIMSEQIGIQNCIVMARVAGQPHFADAADKELTALRAERDGLRDVCEATLSFHSGTEWTPEKQSRWNTIMAKHCPTAGGGGVFERTEATTRNLCNAIRAVLDAARKEQKQ